MSFQASAWAAEQCGMSSGEKLMLYAIANRVDPAGVGFPGRDRLAAEACCRPETATANMRKLEERGLIARFQRRRANGSRTSDWIVLAPSAAGRGPMEDAHPSEYPEAISSAARKGSGEDSSGEDFAPGQVKKTGGPEQSVEQSGEAKASRSRARADVQMFDYWRERCDHPQAKFTADRRTKVRARLAEGYTVEQIRQAIDGAAVGAFVSVEGHRFDDLELICRTGSKLEGFMARTTARPQHNGNGNGRPIGILEQQRWPDGRTWPELTRAEQENAKDSMAMGGRPWEANPDADAPPAPRSNGNGRTLNAANILDDD